jgi:very-short-patch-repair endonuclease
MMSATPSSGAARHLLPQGEKEKTESLPSPLAGEGGSRRLTDEGVPNQRKHRPAPPPPVATVEAFAQRQSKRLRKDMTDVERILWSNLRGRKFEHLKFRRQVPIGRYIADFVCFEHKLIVELDGSQHQESTHDSARDAWLKSQGFGVLRFWNIDILQGLDGALRAILDATTPSLPSPLAGEGGSRRLTDEGVVPAQRKFTR